MTGERPMPASTDSFIHRFVAGSDPEAAPLLLLHGTGGDENDLLPLGQTIAPGAALLSPRGKVLEGGMRRFFRRFAEGVFDEADVAHRADELADFVAAARQHYDIGAPVAVGFSNGANIAAAMLYLRPETLAGAVLIRAMTPLKHPPAGRIEGTRVLILSGAMDQIVPAADVGHLAASLRERGAVVTHETLPTGHGLTRRDMEMAKAFVAG
jgi:phospholipase/carboxylesterase